MESHYRGIQIRYPPSRAGFMILHWRMSSFCPKQCPLQRVLRRSQRLFQIRPALWEDLRKPQAPSRLTHHRSRPTTKFLKSNADQAIFVIAAALTVKVTPMKRRQPNPLPREKQEHIALKTSQTLLPQWPDQLSKAAAMISHLTAHNIGLCFLGGDPWKASPGQVWPLAQFFWVFYCKKSFNCLKGKSKIPYREEYLSLLFLQETLWSQFWTLEGLFQLTWCRSRSLNLLLCFQIFRDTVGCDELGAEASWDRQKQLTQTMIAILKAYFLILDCEKPT